MKSLWGMVCFVLAGLMALPGYAEVKLPALFQDSLVLQRNMDIPVWGWADDGEKVTVTLAGKSRSTTAKDGEWMVKLPDMGAGGPHTLTIEGSNKIELHNVLIGDVWVCSGQSNMQWTVSNTNNAQEEIANAEYPQIRLFYVPRIATGARQDDVEADWQECSPKSVEGFSSVAYFFGRHLHQELGVPIGLIHTSWGGTPAESWTTMETLKGDPDYAPISTRYEQSVKSYMDGIDKIEQDYMTWKDNADAAELKGNLVPNAPEIRFPNDPRRGGWRPAGLFNAMVNPLIPYGIKGAIWYQGESNVGRAYQYRHLFADMITDWRNEWGQGDFPFFYVQIAGYAYRRNPVPEIPWKCPSAELREAQTMTLSLKNTGMAVVTDISEATDIHPRNKQDVGKRLALSALKVAYKKNIVHSGPVYKSMKKKDGGIELRFDSVGDGLKAIGDDMLKDFIIAGEDQKFVKADAKITGKATVLVSSPDVSSPAAVRFGWADVPDTNLFNNAGLPASPFRTDEWKGETEGSN